MGSNTAYTADLVVVGGGLGGLAAAALAARRGLSVTLFERARGLGGRAVTHRTGDFRFNVGPHALYAQGRGVTVLRDLGVAFAGRKPRLSEAYAVDRGAKHALPGGFVSLLSTGLLRLPGKIEAARLLGSMARIDSAAAQGRTVREWLERNVRQHDVRQLLQALLRLATYTDDPERQSAGAALAQLQLALAGGVYYLDEGWQVLVDGLRFAAEQAGVIIVNDTRVVQVEHDGMVRGVRLASGERCRTAAVIMSGAPGDAVGLVDGGTHPTLRRWAEEAIPVRAACLDVGLTRLPRPRALFALGIDQPLYLSVHSAVARLAPAGGATIHVAKYLRADHGTQAKADEQALEGLLDLVQPGWRDVVVERRYLPRMTVAHALPSAAAGGTRARPGPEVPGIGNLYVVGDWVGPVGLLADASLASAQRAAELVRQRAAGRAMAA
jgi:phytoene dehydrogenase-like protein